MSKINLILLEIEFKKQIDPAGKFYFIKRVIDNIDCKKYHYLDRDKKLQIWFEDLESRDKEIINVLLEKYEIKWNYYANRNQIIELIQPACKCIIEDLGMYIEDDYSLEYFIHVILTSLFMGWEEQKEFYKKMVKVATDNIKHYKEKEKKKGKKILCKKRKK